MPVVPHPFKTRSTASTGRMGQVMQPPGLRVWSQPADPQPPGLLHGFVGLTWQEQSSRTSDTFRRDDQLRSFEQRTWLGAAFEAAPEFFAWTLPAPLLSSES